MRSFRGVASPQEDAPRRREPWKPPVHGVLPSSSLAFPWGPRRDRAFLTCGSAVLAAKA